MELTLIRHTAVDVLPGICYGQTDVPLKESFEQEAAVTSARLRELIAAKGAFDTAFTSPISRCTRLANACGYGDAHRDDRLKELNFGEWEMQLFSQIKDSRLQEWFGDYFNVPATGGESFRMQYIRVASFLDELKQKEEYHHVAIFAHGGVLISAQLYAGTITQEEAFSALTPYGGIVEISI